MQLVQIAQNFSVVTFVGGFIAGAVAIAAVGVYLLYNAFKPYP